MPQTPLFNHKPQINGPQRSASSVDVTSLFNSARPSSTLFDACPVLSVTMPPLTPGDNKAPVQSNGPRRLYPPLSDLALDDGQHLGSSMINLSSPSKSLPRTNPYYQPPKSPKTEYGPFSGPPRPVPPPIPPNTPARPFQSTLNLSTLTDSPGVLPNLPPKPRSPPPRPPPLSRSASYASVPTRGPSDSVNPFTSTTSSKKSFNPFLSSSMAPVLPPVSRTWTNPFRAPLSSFPPDDPSDTSRLLGIQLWTDLLAASCVVVTPCDPVPCADVTNNLSDPLTQPPPASASSVTLPPMRKASTGGSGQAPAPAASAAPAVSAGDKYSALAELDDLFRSTGLDTPTSAAAEPAPGLGSVFGLTPGKAPVAPSAVPGVFMSEASNGSPGAGAWGRASPSVTSNVGGWGQGGRDSPGGAGQLWAQSGAAGPQGGKTSPMWTPQWGSAGGQESGMAWD